MNTRKLSTEGEGPATPAEDVSSRPSKPRVDWADASVPVGNAPPLPRWPWFLSIGAWVAWLVFLLLMLFAGGEGLG
jgi:hypothetical protein